MKQKQKLQLERNKLQHANIINRSLKSERESLREKEEALKNYDNMLKKNANLLQRKNKGE